ncbi:chaplin [Streptomyces sp. NPDC048638]|uniref:chaplin n=1 Tax=Streptomyces sp. NPDC048638 TaxID=3365580 RepID=UPI0037146E4D
MRRIAAVALGTTALLGVLATPALADSGAQGAAVNSPGVVSGNVIQAPIHIPVNACGNSINIVGLLNPTFGNTCVNH